MSRRRLLALLLALLSHCQVGPGGRGGQHGWRDPSGGGAGSARPGADTPVPPQGPSAQVTDFLFERWQAYREECHHNMSLQPPPTGQAPWLCGVREEPGRPGAWPSVPRQGLQRERGISLQREELGGGAGALGLCRGPKA